MSGPVANPAHIVIASTRRSWSAEQKRAIIAETQVAGATTSAVARRHGVHSSLLFRWRREFLEAERAAARPSQPAFVALRLPAPAGVTTIGERSANPMIEIELAGGHRLRADASIDVAILRSLLEVLVGR
jgi:transposase